MLGGSVRLVLVSVERVRDGEVGGGMQRITVKI